MLGGEGQAVTEIIESVPMEIDARQLSAQLAEWARAEGADLLGQGGLCSLRSLDERGARLSPQQPRHEYVADLPP